MRILRVAQTYYPDVKGGGAYHVHAMSRDQAAMGHDVTVLTVSDDESLPRREEREGYTVIRMKPTIDILDNEISVSVAKYLKEAIDYDVIHAHSHLYFSTNLAAIKARIGKIPLAITNHGLYSQNAPERLFDIYLQTVGRWTFNQASVVFCYTSVERDDLRRIGVRSPIEVVHNGIDTNRFTPDGSGHPDIKKNGPVVLFVGRLVEGKRPGDVLEAFAYLQDRRPDAKLYFCGNGPLRSNLKADVRAMDLSENIEFLGYVPYEMMPSLYREADVVMLPSRSEGFPRTILEALATGTPVVCNNLAQISAEIGEIVQTVPNGAISGYVEELDRAISIGATTKRADRIQTINEEFSWENTVNETTEKIRDLI